MARLIDLTGRQFGRLTVIHRDHDKQTRSVYWICVCECGNRISVRASHLSDGGTKSCGCISPNFKDLIGQRFARLFVKARVENNRRGRAVWKCLCDCGNTVTVNAGSLISGNTKSCGCLKHDVGVANGKARRRHGMTKSKAWICWDSMLQRCNNPNHKSYHHYGGRGISVCERWHVFENFYDDMGEPNGLTLDRIDVNGNYDKANCRWATMKEQGRNTRVNRFLTLDGETMTIADFTERYDLSDNMIADRLKRGWTVEDAILKPNSYIKRWLYINGIKRPFMDVAREYGIHPVTLQDRLARGWPLEKAISTPVAHIPIRLTFEGETMSITGWAKRLDVDRKWLRRQLDKMPVADAFVLAKTRQTAKHRAA